MGEERVEEKRGFKVIDKRVFAQEEGKEEKKAEERRRQETERVTKEEVPLPEVTFSSFIYSLSTTCLVHLGEIPEPTTQKIQKNLPLAKQTIDVLGILLEKTKGNLTEEEERLLQSVLTDLRIRYVRAVSS
ncbi:MAG TPA: DUF1844 domain-containing protein [Deltaproteobacteria bacterium]|nr:DUF1844 domain-containing protein [Deltaproteobacteria bacterium]